MGYSELQLIPIKIRSYKDIVATFQPINQVCVRPQVGDLINVLTNDGNTIGYPIIMITHCAGTTSSIQNCKPYLEILV